MPASRSLIGALLSVDEGGGVNFVKSQMSNWVIAFVYRSRQNETIYQMPYLRYRHHLIDVCLSSDVNLTSQRAKWPLK